MTEATDSPLHKYEVVLMSKDSGDMREILTVESTKTLEHFNGVFDVHLVWLFSQVLLDKVDVVSDMLHSSYKLEDLGRREPVLLVVANIVSIRRAAT